MKIPKFKNIHFLSKPERFACVICEKPTNRKIMNRYNGMHNYQDNYIDPDKLDWGAVVRFATLLEQRAEGKTLPVGISVYNIRVGRMNSWNRLDGSVSIAWEGEDFRQSLPYTVLEMVQKRSIFTRKDKKKALTKVITKRNQDILEMHRTDREHDTGNACCSQVCLNMWLLQEG